MGMSEKLFTNVLKICLANIFARFLVTLRVDKGWLVQFLRTALGAFATVLKYMILLFFELLNTSVCSYVMSRWLSKAAPLQWSFQNATDALIGKQGTWLFMHIMPVACSLIWLLANRVEDNWMAKASKTFNGLFRSDSRRAEANPKDSQSWMQFAGMILMYSFVWMMNASYAVSSTGQGGSVAAALAGEVPLLGATPWLMENTGRLLGKSVSERVVAASQWILLTCVIVVSLGWSTFAESGSLLYALVLIAMTIGAELLLPRSGGGRASQGGAKIMCFMKLVLAMQISGMAGNAVAHMLPHLYRGVYAYCIWISIVFAAKIWTVDFIFKQIQHGVCVYDAMDPTSAAGMAAIALSPAMSGSDVYIAMCITRTLRMCGFSLDLDLTSNGYVLLDPVRELKIIQAIEENRSWDASMHVELNMYEVEFTFVKTSYMALRAEDNSSQVGACREAVRTLEEAKRLHSRVQDLRTCMSCMAAARSAEENFRYILGLPEHESNEKLDRCLVEAHESWRDYRHKDGSLDDGDLHSFYSSMAKVVLGELVLVHNYALQRRREGHEPERPPADEIVTSALAGYRDHVRGKLFKTDFIKGYQTPPWRIHVLPNSAHSHGSLHIASSSQASSVGSVPAMAVANSMDRTARVHNALQAVAERNGQGSIPVVQAVRADQGQQCTQNRGKRARKDDDGGDARADNKRARPQMPESLRYAVSCMQKDIQLINSAIRSDNKVNMMQAIQSTGHQNTFKWGEISDQQIVTNLKHICSQLDFAKTLVYQGVQNGNQETIDRGIEIAAALRRNPDAGSADDWSMSDGDDQD